MAAVVVPAKPVSTSSPPGCCEGFFCFFRLLRDVLPNAGKDDKAARLDVKLDELNEKIDFLARQVTADRQVSGQSTSSISALQVREEAERLGIEIARYAKLPQFDASILDTFIPRCRRLTQLHFGAIVSNPHAPMAFKEKMGYNMTFNMVPPGNGNALHMHRSIEIFVALDGKWEIAWGMKGEHTVVLQPWDFVAVPARVCHSYKNIESDTAHNIMTILPGKSWITWAPDVVGEARKHGAECDDNGMLLKYAKLIGGADIKKLGGQSDAAEWRSMGPNDMQPYLHRFSEQKPFECIMHEEATGDGPAPFIEMFWKMVGPETNFQLPQREGVDLLLVVLDGSVIVKSEAGRSMGTAGRLDSVRIPAQALSKSAVIVANPCTCSCTLLVTATQMRNQNDLFFHLC
jgi:mannose-6-phosphate isomerase-like protein (cupin superfamily)